MMKIPRFATLGLLAMVAAGGADAAEKRDRSFDFGCRFLRADAPGADTPDFDHSPWSNITLLKAEADNLKSATVTVPIR